MNKSVRLIAAALCGYALLCGCGSAKEKEQEDVATTPVFEVKGGDIATTADWRNYQEEAAKCIKLRDYDKAIPLLKGWLKQTFVGEDPLKGKSILPNLMDSDLLFTADTFLAAADYRLIAKKPTEAEELAVLAYKLYERLKEVPDFKDFEGKHYELPIDKGLAWGVIARAQLMQEKYADAEKSCDKALSFMKTPNAASTNYPYCEVLYVKMKALKSQNKPFDVTKEPYSVAYKFYPEACFAEPTKWSIYEKDLPKWLRSRGRPWQENDLRELRLADHVQSAIDYGKSDPRYLQAVFRKAEFELDGNEETAPESEKFVDLIATTGQASFNQLAEELADRLVNLPNPRDPYPNYMIADRALLRAYNKIDGPQAPETKKFATKYAEALLASTYSDGWREDQFKPVQKELEATLGFENLPMIKLESIVLDELRFDKPYDAMLIQEKIVSASEKVYGPKHKKTGLAYKRYSELLDATNDRAEAVKAMAKAKEILGVDPYSVDDYEEESEAASRD